MAPQPIALVLAGGGARGAYEAGVLSVLLPALPEAERPNLILGASVGAINGAYLAATLPDGGDLALDGGRAIWEEISWSDVMATPSVRDLERLAARRADLHRPALARHPRAAGHDPAEGHARARDPVRAHRRARRAGPPEGRRGDRHQRAHGPQRRLPRGRDAGRGPRRQARHRLRPRRPRPRSTCAPPRRSRPRSRRSRSTTARARAGTSTAASASTRRSSRRCRWAPSA